jgi:hypothetical protein
MAIVSGLPVAVPPVLIVKLERRKVERDRDFLVNYQRRGERASIIVNLLGEALGSLAAAIGAVTFWVRRI